MKHNIFKPMFLGQDSVGTLILYFSKKHILYFSYMQNIYFRVTRVPDAAPMARAQMERPCRAHPGPRWSAHAGPIQGPDGAPMQGRWEKPPDPDPDELSDPNQVPSHRTQGENTSLRGPSLRLNDAPRKSSGRLPARHQCTE